MPVRVTVGPTDPQPTPKKSAPKSPASKRRRNRTTPTPPAPPRRDAVAANDTNIESEDTK